MAFKSIQTHVSDGTLESVQFSIASLSTEHLHFYVDDVEVTTSTASQGVMVDGVDEYGVTLTAAVPLGAVFKVQRQTPRDNVPHVFSTGAALFTALTTDANNEYLLYVVQETYEQSGQGPFPEITGLVGTEYVTVETGGARKQITVRNFLASVASTATLILDLANDTDPAKGAGMVGDVKFGTAKAALDRVISALRGDTGKSYRVVSAILRNTGSGWFVLEDGGHNPIGVNSVTVNEDGSLHVDYDNLGQANIVNTLLAVPDETFASMGIVMGSSVSNEFCNIYLYAPLDFRIDLDSGAVSAPDFFYPEISMSVATDAFTINHPHIVYADNTTLSASPVGGAASLGAQAKTSPISNTSTTLEINTTLSTYIAYDGSAFTCSLGNSGTQITAAWNGALLHVTRPDVGVNNIGSINITPRYPYQAFFDGMSGANADIRFCTKAGVDVVTPDTNMRITYSETFPNVQAGQKKLTSGVYQFSANLARINANNLASAGGNIWLFGVMEEVV